MAIRTILTYPNPVLQRVAKPVERFDVNLANLVKDMVDTMRAENGIGLAAPQIGESVRLIVLEVQNEDPETGEPANEPTTIYSVCNPEITQRSGTARIEEGCLSCPGFYVEVDRSSEVRIEGQLPDGSLFSLDAKGLLAICFQHEIDHLDGKLLVNYVSPIKRTLYRKEMKRRKKKDGSVEDRRPTL
jgi:peptide deformylase